MKINKEVVTATATNLIDALTNALLKIKPRTITQGIFTVKIEIEEVKGNDRKTKDTDKGN